MLTKREIKNLSKKEGFYLKKSLGQNFLVDKNTRDKIIRLLELKSDDVVLEIGPGLGALTEGLAERVKCVYAVEKDEKIYNLSKEILAKHKNIVFQHCDFLKFNINSMLFDKIKIVGALPYYITTPIIERIFHYKERIDSAYIIIQKEVARRITAKPGTKDYSSLSLFTRFNSDARLLADIKKDSFFPVPKVDSTLIKLDILATPHIPLKDEETLFKVIRQAFNQRRKTILSSLSHKKALGLDKKDMETLLQNINIDKSCRAETLALEEFARIADGIIDFLL